jgi:hypothetical protein
VFDIKHFLSLPAFIFLGADVKQGIASLSSPTSSTPALTAYLILLVNLFTQLFCVSGVNRLSSVRHIALLPIINTQLKYSLNRKFLRFQQILD